MTAQSGTPGSERGAVEALAAVLEGHYWYFDNKPQCKCGWNRAGSNADVTFARHLAEVTLTPDREPGLREAETAGSGRPSNERDGACICDYNPTTTQGPEEDCPFHGRPYRHWIERGDLLQERLTAVEALAGEWERTAERCEARLGPPPCSTCAGRQLAAARLRAILDGTR